MMRKVHGAMRSRTMWWSLVIIILGVIADNLSYFHDQLGDQSYGLILMGIGIVTAVLRWNTDSSLEDR